jgi:hypothetical protein
MNGLPYDFTDKEVSPWGGLRLFEGTYRQSGLKQYLEEQCPDLPLPGSNRGYSSIYLAEGFMVSTILGATRLSHSGTLLHDEVIQRIFGWDKGMASQSTFSRFFRKFDQELNDKLFPAINRSWFTQLKLDKMTFDLDSTVITRHGSQDRVSKGDNHKRNVRGSHHPLIAFVAEAKMVANAWMRTGDSASSTDFTEFFVELLTITPPDRIGLFGADSGICNETIMSRLEKEKLKYIMSTRMMGPLVRRIIEYKERFPVDVSYWTDIIDYQGKGWSKSYRMVVVCKETGKHPDTGGKLLFPDIHEVEQYRYAAFTTNVEFSSALVWQLYNQRTDYENRIRELKYDFGIEGFCMDDFYAMEAAFRLTMVAHNLMSLFQLQVHNQKRHPVLSTMRFQCIAIGSYLVKTCRKITLKLSTIQKWRQFLEGLFSILSNLSPPFQISNAHTGFNY